jgi:hypothetical protein
MDEDRLANPRLTRIGRRTQEDHALPGLDELALVLVKWGMTVFAYLLASIAVSLQ